MATHDVNLGVGNYAETGTTGMFYHAPAGTALPAHKDDTLAQAWEEVGAVAADGISFNSNKSYDNLRNWANQIERMIPGTDSATMSVPVISTTEESLKTIFGANNVTVQAANAQHGKLVNVDITTNSVPEAEAYLFIMKDDDDTIMFGTTKGYISELGEVAFQPDAAITWTATVTADRWTFVKDNGQKSS